MNTLKTGNVDEKDIMCLSVLSPRRGTLVTCGAFNFDCLPHPWEFDKESGPQGGDIWFFSKKEWNQITSSHPHLCNHLEIVLVEKNTCVLELSTCFQGIKQLLTTHFQHILIEYLPLWRLCGFLIYRQSSAGINILHSLTSKNYASVEMNRHLKGNMLQHYAKMGIFDLTSLIFLALP